MTFDDTRLISDLFGEYDEHLAMIEKALDVVIAARGNELTIAGQDDGFDRARQVLESLYHQLQAGDVISRAEVDGAIRLSAQLPLDNETDRAKTSSRIIPAKVSTRKRTISARAPGQNAYLEALENADLIFAAGPAGTGKTFLAVAYAAAMLEKGLVERIILSRPAVEAGERLGFLPGDMREKVDPYLRPLYDGLHEMMGPERVEKGLQTDTIEIAPLAFMRGRTLSRAAVILDEAQNCTSMQMKMFLTRLGEGTKMVVTGDPSQIDLPHGQTSGLGEAMRLLQNINGVAQIHFNEKDVVRHELVARIVKAYDQDNSPRDK